MAKDRITLLGTVHIDPFGEERLKRAIDVLQPDWISVESYPEAEAVHKFVAEHPIRAFLSHALAQTSWSQFWGSDVYRANILLQRQRFELKVSRTSKKPCYEVDLRDYTPDPPQNGYMLSSNEQLRAFNQQSVGCAIGLLPAVMSRNPFSLEATVKRSDEEPKLDMDAGRALALALYSRKEQSELMDALYAHNYYGESVALDQRDDHMAVGIREAVAERGTNGLHVGGLAHMFGKGRRNLYDRLKDDLPVDRAKLNWFK